VSRRRALQTGVRNFGFSFLRRGARTYAGIRLVLDRPRKRAAPAVESNVPLCRVGPRPRTYNA